MRTKKKKERYLPYILIAPGLVLVILLLTYPVAESIRLSLIDYDLLRPNSHGWNNFANYIKLFKDENLLRILRNSFVWVAVVVSFQFLLGLLLALLLNKTFRGKGIYQSIVFLPWATAAYVIAIIFRQMFSQNNGVINYLLMQLGFISEPISWLGTESLSLIGPMTAMIWYGIPFFGIMLLAALQSIPGDVLEAGKIDGASGFDSFRHIVLPYIKPTIVITVLLRFIWVFNSTDIIYTMTSGGPANSSSTLPLYAYNRAFSSLDFGYGAAVGVLIMVFMVVYALIYLKVTKYEEADNF